MKLISVSELEINTGKYVAMATNEDIMITKNGKVVAKLVTAKADKKAALEHFLHLFPKEGLQDITLEQIKDERLGLR